MKDQQGDANSYRAFEPRHRSPTWRGSEQSLSFQHRAPKINASVHVLLTLAHADPTELVDLDRGERYRRMMAHAQAQRQRIQRWLEVQGLAGEVTRLGDPNTFNLLFICCTERVAAELYRAPDVIDVAITK